MVPQLVRRHPVIGTIAVVSIVGWIALGFARGAPSVPFYLIWMTTTATIVVVLDRRHPFSGLVLGGLTLWGFMHLAGGLLPVGDEILYQQWLLPVLRYDQLTHAIGFGFAGLAAAEQFEPWIPHPRLAATASIVSLGGLSTGAINEMLGFLLTRIAPDTNVGGFDNTGWDLVANTVGSATAAAWAARRARP